MLWNTNATPIKEQQQQQQHNGKLEKNAWIVARNGMKSRHH